MTLLEPSSPWVKIATLALCVAVLGVLEFRLWLAGKGKWLFPAALSALIASYALICAATYFWNGSSSEPFAAVFPWLLAALGVLGIALAFYEGIKRQRSAAVPSAAATIDGQSRLDLIHLLDFAANQTTILMLDWLLEESDAPAITEGFRGGSDTEEAHNSRHFFTGWVAQQFGMGTHRHAEYMNVLHQAEIDAERVLQVVPPAERPSDVDLLALRRYRISELQFRRTIHFINHQKHEVRERIIHQRRALIERLQQRNDQR